MKVVERAVVEESRRVGEAPREAERKVAEVLGRAGVGKARPEVVER